jgi:membrane protein implicated in regulation of membrane protease activity
MLKTISLLLLTMMLLALVSPVLAYIGPGAGISVLGSLLSILATIVVAIGAILFWPVRKFMKRRKAGRVSRLDTETDSSGDDAKSDNTRG